MSDDLEQRLQAADPVPPTTPVDSPRSPRAQTLVERIMTDNLIEIDQTPASPSRRRVAMVAAAVAALAAVGGVVAFSGDDAPDTAPLALSVAADDPMQMCIALDATILRDASEVAFAATATAVEGSTATLTVDHWYGGDEVDEVTVTAPPESEIALLGGFEFEEGGEYLISGAGGAVQTCGLSGPASAELEAIYEAAFPG